jgi:gliding motility-associated-like protein
MSVSPLQGCLPLDVQFADASQAGSTPIVGYQWTLGNGSTYNFPTANQPYLLPGSYPISLTVTDGNGCTATALDTVQAFAGPEANFSASLQQACAPIAISFSYVPGSGTPPANWSWDFGDGSTGSGAFPSHTYQSNGSYDVQLLVEDANGCKDSLMVPQYIQLGEISAEFAVSDSQACPGTILNFLDLTQPDTSIVSWQWNFGDGSSGTGNNPSHSYAAPGTYAVVLQITDALGCSGSDTLPQAVEIWQPPLANFVRSDSSGCAPMSVSFVDVSTPNGSPIVGWTWDFNNGQTSFQTNPGTTYPLPGTYAPSLVVTDGRGCSDSLSLSVAAFSPPTANFLSQTQLACVGQGVDFQSASNGPHPIVSWLWEFGDGGVSTLSNPTHAYASAGTYSVSLTVIDSEGCVGMIDQPNWISVRAPAANFLVQPTPACPGTLISFVDASQSDTALVAWQWTLGDGNTASVPNFSHTYAQSGLYDVSLLITDAMGCTDTLTQPGAVEMFAPPQAHIQAPDGGCWPLVLQASDSSQSPVGLNSWSWSLNGGQLSAGASVNYFLDSIGTHFLQLIVTDANGCRDTSSQAIEVYPLPDVDFGVNDTVGCAPQVFLFSDQSQPTPTAWLWDFGDGATSSVQNPVHTYQDDGLYSVQLIVTDARACVDSLTRPDLILLGRPEGEFVVSYQPDCPPVAVSYEAVGSSPYGILSYKWAFGDGQEGSGPTATHVYADTGTYDIRLTITDSLGCSEEIVQEAAVKIYGVEQPDPVQMHRISVRSDEAIQLVWKPDFSADFGAYVLYRENASVPGNWLLVQEISSRLDTVYEDESPGVLDCLSESYCYKLVVRNQCGTEGSLLQSRTHCSVELTATPLPDRIRLSWNPYEGWDQVRHYEIYRVDSYDPASANLIAQVAGSSTSYLDSSTQCFQAYTYRIRAVGGPAAAWSWSDTTHAINQKAQPTVSTDLVRATVENNEHIRVDWLGFGLRDLVSVFLEKSNDGGQSWGTVATLPPTATTYLDTAVRVDAQPYAYRLLARDSCGFSSPYSNLGTSIWLQATTENFQHRLNWTPYREWAGGVDYYVVEVWMEALGEYVQVDVVSGSETTYLDGATFLDQGEYCYRITAHELAGNQAVSLSNRACVGIKPELHLPNAFSPNGDNINDQFRLNGLYIRDFDLKIFNRWGQKIFESDHLDKGWDGTFRGASVPEGVYVVVVEAVANNGQRFYEKGSITLIR